MTQETTHLTKNISQKKSSWKKLFTRKSTIAILSLQGVIGHHVKGQGGLTLESYNALIEKAFETRHMKALVLVINSPGGSPVQTELLFRRIRQLADKNKIPVLSFVEDVAASGGYWLACAGEEIFASRSSIVGSIGVISASFGFVETLEKCGIERRVYKQGKNKASLDPFLPEREEDIEVIKRVQKDIHQHFIDAVKNRRRNKLSETEELFDGSFWSGKEALTLGLIDAIGDMYDVLEKRYGSDISYVYLSKPTSWLKRKLGIYAGDVFLVLWNMIEEKIMRQKIGSH